MSTEGHHDEKSAIGAVAATDAVANVDPFPEQRTGLADLEGIKRNWNIRSLIVIWISAGLMSFVVNLNNQSSSTFTPYAASGFSSAPLVGTIAVVQAVIASGCMLATSGEIFRSIWITAPFAASVLKVSWRWGFGIFAILIPVIGTPLVLSLWHNRRKATKQEKAQGTYKRRHYLGNIIRLDPIGLILFAAGLSLLLVPITLAASSTNTWKTPHIIAMIVIGFFSLVAFVIWEIKWAPWPMLSMRLFKSRTVIFGLTASLIDYTALYLVQDYIVIYELVAAELSVKAATNIAILIPFTAAIGQFTSAFVVKYTKRYKWVTVSGYAMNLLGLGLSYKYINGHDHLGALVVSQLILGFGEGVINTMQLGMQASVHQDDMAAVTALFTAALGVGSAFGGAVSGGVWTAILPRRLREYLPSDALGQLAEIDGSIEVAAGYPWGSSTRNAINHSYTSTFRLMLLIAVILEVFALGFALLIEDLNVKEVDDSREYKGIVIGKTGAIDTLKGRIHVKQDEVVA
ncbi:hypothetical protein N7490_002558 [Penicillium lividum]|nr:hypothetical protein N7490_002558 [Penicillium lividum]